MGKGQRLRKSAAALHKEVERRQRQDARRQLDRDIAKGGIEAVITENWDGSSNVLVSTGKANKIDVQHAPKPEPGEHVWAVIVSYRVDIDAFDARDTDDPASGLGALGPDRVISATPPICSECATVYTPEERNTRCTGVVPNDDP